MDITFLEPVARLLAFGLAVLLCVPVSLLARQLLSPNATRLNRVLKGETLESESSSDASLGFAVEYFEDGTKTILKR